MKRYQVIGAGTVLALVVLVGGLVYQNNKIKTLTQSLAAVESSVAQIASTASSTIPAATSVNTNSSVAPTVTRSTAARTQNQQLQDAVAKVSPAVVSIVETKVVKKLQVSYENPFGNDPFFQGFGTQVPVYREVGTTTQKVAAGTGFIVRSNGYIITNKHVVGDTAGTYTVLLSNGRQLNGDVVWRSSTADVAVVKIAGVGYPTVPLGNSAALSLGETVFAVGNALGEYSNSISVGVVSGLNRSIQASDELGNIETLKDVIQTDAAINPGNSGGPLVDLSGSAVGINIATIQGSQSIGFSLPINDVKQALAQLGI